MQLKILFLEKHVFPGRYAYCVELTVAACSLPERGKVGQLYNDVCVFSYFEGGFPVMAETTRNHIFSKETSQVIIAAMVLAPNFC